MWRVEPQSRMRLFYLLSCSNKLMMSTNLTWDTWLTTEPNWRPYYEYIMHWLSRSHSPFFSTLVLCRMVWQKEVVKTIYKFWNKLRFISIAKISSWGICCPWGTYLIIRACEGHFYLQIVPSYACSKCGPPLFGCCYRYIPHYNVWS